MSEVVSVERLPFVWVESKAYFLLESAQESRNIHLEFDTNTQKWSGRYLEYDNNSQDWKTGEEFTPGKAERLAFERKLIVCR